MSLTYKDEFVESLHHCVIRSSRRSKCLGGASRKSPAATLTPPLMYSGQIVWQDAAEPTSPLFSMVIAHNPVSSIVSPFLYSWTRLDADGPLYILPSAGRRAFLSSLPNPKWKTVISPHESTTAMIYMFRLSCEVQNVQGPPQWRSLSKRLILTKSWTQSYYSASSPHAQALMPQWTEIFIVSWSVSWINKAVHYWDILSQCWALWAPQTLYRCYRLCDQPFRPK